jgi:uncharacterized oxidoreductase
MGSSMDSRYSGAGAWKDRVVVVTGGGSGIGRAFAQRFAAAGAKVVVCGRNDTALAELRAQHPAIETLHCDVADSRDLMQFVDTIEVRHGLVDVLVNNAGIMERVDLLAESVSDERIVYETAVNLTAPILLTRRLLPLLRSSAGPMIVMVTSGYALLPATNAPTYSATKAGLRSFTMALRRQLDGVGIRVVEVLPPLVDTPATRDIGKPKMPPAALVDRVLRDIARGRNEILPGNVRLLPMLMRIAPLLAARIVAGG